MPLPTFDHLDWIASHADRDIAHLDWSSLPPADPDEIGVDPPDIGHQATAETVDLKTRIAETHDVSEGEVLVTLGATEAVVCAVAALADEGPVAVEEPTYQPLRDVPAMLGADVQRFPRPADDGFAVDVDAVQARLEAGCELVVLANLHNPTGVGIEDEDLAAVCQAAADHDAWVLVDEVYRRSALGATAGPACRYARGLVADSLTKFFGYGQQRVGWLIGDADVVEQARRAKQLLNPGQTGPGAHVAAWCLDHEDDLTRHAAKRLEANRAIVEDWIDRHNVDWVPPDGGNVCAPRIGGDDVAFARRAVEAGVAVVPGSYFEMPGYVRVAFGVEQAMLKDGLERLGELV